MPNAYDAIDELKKLALEYFNTIESDYMSFIGDIHLLLGCTGTDKTWTYRAAIRQLFTALANSEMSQKVSDAMCWGHYRDLIEVLNSLNFFLEMMETPKYSAVITAFDAEYEPDRYTIEEIERETKRYDLLAQAESLNV